MLKRGILNPQLAGRLARLGHTDTLVIADCGLPIPESVPVVDLSLVFGIPRFADVLRAVSAELEIEGVTIADATPDAIRALLPGAASGNLIPREVSHERLKEMVADASFVVRTGETTPFANAILHCGVPF